MTGQRHNDGSGGGMYPPLTQSNTPTGNVYESRNAYGLHSSQPGSSSSLGPPGSLPWGQHTVTHVNVGAMAANTQQTSAAYQSSVSPVIPTGGMSFARPGGSKSNQTVDEEFDGRTRNAKAQKRHREKRKAHVKHLEETVLALQNHVRSLTRNQPLDPSGRPYLSPLTGGFPSQTELEDLSARNVMLTEENQCLKAEVDHLRLKLSEPQGLSYPMSTSAPADMANRALASGPISVSNRTSSAITPISDDEPNRSLSLNLPSLTVNVKGEGVGQHYSPMDVTPTSSNPQMQSYGAAYGYSEPRRYYLSNIDQSPPLQPLSSGSSNLVQNPALGLSNVYHRYDVSQNHNTEGGAPSGFPPNLPSASLQPHSRQSGAMNNAVAGPPFSNQGAGGYALGPSAGGTSEKMAVPGILDGDSG
ncbi:hypothetical protein QFC19_001788 [Naganishia cerealis]|uniref:Uncharacterized protein n=1 Tax=Naganishia cerealis TaxID=610337 RepID=A0ACC2WHT4_9TREE|nr:hypothetical protein QFC19_001788 [Naganishia cerealis]